MRHYSTAYVIDNGETRVAFDSEKEACEYLKVKRCSVASCYRSGSKCKGFDIERVGVTTHHSSNSRIFKIWDSMKQRCYLKSHTQYHNYGGRGIAICDEWLGDNGFYAFQEWAMEHGYSDELTIDRIDVNGDYTPKNCRWVTMKEQARNKRNNRVIDYKGQTMTLTEASEKYGIKMTTLKERLNLGWSVEKAIETPIRLRTKGWRPSAKMERGEE